VKRILFVDDESKILDGIRRMLHADRERWEMHFALGGEAALQACDASAFDVVISDMRMPGMDGATLLTHIRNRFPTTARIILSGYSDASMTMRAVPVAHRYVAKPCNANELRAMIERVCALRDILRTPEVQRVVGTIGELPSLSNSYTALAEAVQDPNATIVTVTKIIERDLAMSAKVLQLVNSAFFGLARSVTNLQSAVTHLGIQTVKNLALASEAFRVFQPDRRISRQICEDMETHAHRTAAIAATLPIERPLREATVLAALLHDIGQLVLASKMPDYFCAAIALAREKKCEIFEAEEQVLGTSHAEIGAYLLGLWGIPSLAVEAIAYHHHPTSIPHSDFDSSVAVYVADFLAHHDSPESEIRPADLVCMDSLGILPRLAEFRALAAQSRR
jgi:HD-like signal output (HDOD) protein